MKQVRVKTSLPRIGKFTLPDLTAMKPVLILFSILLSCFFCFADNPKPKEAPAATNGIELIWKVSSNNWPSTIWVYKIVPQNFSPMVISNLMALGPFTMANQTNVEGQRPFKDKRLRYFTDTSRKKELGIFPPFGWIYYHHYDAEPKKGEKSMVPNDEEAYQLAINYLRRFGIDCSQLATKEDGLKLRTMGEVGHRGYFDKEKGEDVKIVINRGVFFIRRVDGIDFDGIGSQGGIYFSFGNEGKLARLEINWKGLEAFQLHKTFTPDQIIEALRNRKAKWGTRVPAWSEIKKITITEAMPRYRGVSGDDQEQKFVEPYVELTASVDNGITNITAKLECPILGELAK